MFCFQQSHAAEVHSNQWIIGSVIMQGGQQRIGPATSSLVAINALVVKLAGFPEPISFRSRQKRKAAT